MMKTGSRFAHILEKGSGKFISPVQVPVPSLTDERKDPKNCLVPSTLSFSPLGGSAQRRTDAEFTSVSYLNGL